MRMRVPGSLEEPLENQQVTPHEGFGLGQPVRGLEQLRQVVEVYGDIGMIRSEALLINGQGAAHERFGVGEKRFGLIQHAKLIQEQRYRRIRLVPCLQ